MSPYPLVVFGDDWGRHVSSMQHLLRHLFASHPTIWVNGIGHRVPALSDAQRAWKKFRDISRPRTGAAVNSIQHATSNGDGSMDAALPTSAPRSVVHPMVVPLHHWSGVERLNAWSLTRAIRGALAGAGLGRPVVITGTPPSVAVLGKLDEIATIYFCMDDWAHLPTVSPHMLLPLERRLLAGADAVVATARTLMQLKVPENGRIHYLPQGVNFEHFSTRRAVPGDIMHLPRPWIGFAGGVGPALDVDVIHALAAEFPRGSIILVGPEQEGLGDIRAPNIHRLGARPYDVLPAYVQAFDVGIIPYLRNAWTESVDPLKLLEYLAAGIPVITTDLPEVRKYSTSVRIADGVPAFVAHARDIMVDEQPGGRSIRQAVAAANTWQARAAEFQGIMDDVVQAKLSPRGVTA